MTDAICGVQESRCYCAEPPGHEGARHTCACGGSWEETETEFVMWALPGTNEGFDRAPDFDRIQAMGLPQRFPKGATPAPDLLDLPPALRELIREATRTQARDFARAEEQRLLDSLRSENA